LKIEIQETEVVKKASKLKVEAIRKAEVYGRIVLVCSRRGELLLHILLIPSQTMLGG